MGSREREQGVIQTERMLWGAKMSSVPVARAADHRILELSR